MIKRIFDIILIIIALSPVIVIGQTEVHDVSIVAGQNWPLQFNTPAGFAPTIKDFPTEGNELVYTGSNGSGEYYFEYSPADGFIGEDGFSIEVIQSVFPPQTILHVFQVEVSPSVVETANDYKLYSQEDSLIIDVAANDYFETQDYSVYLVHSQNGDAYVNGNNEIVYFPGDSYKDVLVYTLMDEVGTSDKGYVYLHERQAVVESEYRSYAIGSNENQIIFFNSDQFSLQTDTLLYGTLNIVDPEVSVYTSKNGVSGVEVLTFVDSSGNELLIDVQVFETSIPPSNAKDDRFFGAMNTQIIFDVTENDLGSTQVISDYSDDLMHLGAGVFAYTPTPGFKGVKDFFYTTDNGQQEETAQIELVINNYEPLTFETYELNVVADKPRVIEYQTPLASNFFEMEEYPLHGSAMILTANDTMPLECNESVSSMMIVYEPNEGFTGSDHIAVRYCASDNNICKVAHINLEVVDVEAGNEACICVENCVWPGDTNQDGKVSVTDIFHIGKHFGQTGPSRTESPYAGVYDGADAENWMVSDGKHADVTGDGLVDDSDVETLKDLLGSSHSMVSNDVLGIRNVPVYLVPHQTSIDSGELAVFDVVIGSEAFPLTKAQGISFGFYFNPDLVDSSSVEIALNQDGYFVNDQPTIEVAHQPTDGAFHFAASRIGSNTANGYGIIATISFIGEDISEGIKTPGKRASSDDLALVCSLKDVHFQDESGLLFGLSEATETIYLNRSKIESDQSDWIVYPNPGYNLLNIEPHQDLVESVQIFKSDGTLVRSININQSIISEVITVQVDELSQGMYLIQTITQNGEVKVKKWMKF